MLHADPNNPGANHLYIHAVKPSTRPELASKAAERLCDLVPASSHLLHMPSHIYVLTGRWAEASKQNEKAIAADRAYRKVAPEIGFYNVYMAHNHHMLAFASMMQGQADAALRAARTMVENIPEKFLRESKELVDPYMSIPYDVLKRFGKWDELLAEPAPQPDLPITNALWRCNRAVAYAAKGDVESAERERESFRAAVEKVPEDAMMDVNEAHHVLSIAEHFLNGEIAYRKGSLDESIAELRKAVVLEDQLRYMEPPQWIQPVRHTLGAFLVDAGRYDEAREVYARDLEKWPDNGWSLYGLARCLRAKGEASKAEAKQVEQRFQDVWARASQTIDSSCLCVIGQ